MFALAGSAGAVAPILAQNPHIRIRRLIFFSDNQAAISTTTDTTAQPKAHLFYFAVTLITFFLPQILSMLNSSGS